MRRNESNSLPRVVGRGLLLATCAVAVVGWALSAAYDLVAEPGWRRRLNLHIPSSTRAEASIPRSLLPDHGPPPIVVGTSPRDADPLKGGQQQWTFTLVRSADRARPEERDPIAVELVVYAADDANTLVETDNLVVTYGLEVHRVKLWRENEAVAQVGEWSSTRSSSTETILWHSLPLPMRDMFADRHLSSVDATMEVSAASLTVLPVGARSIGVGAYRRWAIAPTSPGTKSIVVEIQLDVPEHSGWVVSGHDRQSVIREFRVKRSGFVVLISVLKFAAALGLISVLPRILSIARKWFGARHGRDQAPADSGPQGTLPATETSA